ncbi:MAG TPA: HEAT repeat domain-containing protein [Kofleriaceae bacterium]|nr:HEAT repeat domain-containing protein [Kofleriaceae bacterium]
MWRAVVALTACMLCMPGVARADAIAHQVRELGSSDSSDRVRLAAVLALSKSHDPRAVIAIADALGHDDDPTIRRIAAIALEKNVNARTAEDAREIALDSLEAAAQNDGDDSVRAAAAKAFKALAHLHRRHRHVEAALPPRDPGSDRPEVFVHIDTTTDQSKKAPSEAADRLHAIVKANIDRVGYATSWPGGLPTAQELAVNRSRAFIVASTVKTIEITRLGHQTQIACTLAIRIAPWEGSDGGEKWEASKAASASGSAKATTGSSERDIRGGVRDCLDAVAEDVTSRQIVPFLRTIAAADSPSN